MTTGRKSIRATRHLTQDQIDNAIASGYAGGHAVVYRTTAGDALAPSFLKTTDGSKAEKWAKQHARRGDTWTLVRIPYEGVSVDDGITFHGPRIKLNALSSGPGRKINGLTFQEWAKRAGYSEAAKKLTGNGYESPEIAWQMGEDPEAELAQNKKDALDLDDFLRSKGKWASHNALSEMGVESDLPSSGAGPGAYVAIGMGAALLGAAAYFGFTSSSTTPAPAPSPSPGPSPAPAPKPTPGPAPKPAPAPAAKPAPAPVSHPAATAPTPSATGGTPVGASTAPIPRVPTPAEAAPEAFSGAATTSTPLNATPQGDMGLAIQGATSTSSDTGGGTYQQTSLWDDIKNAVTHTASGPGYHLGLPHTLVFTTTAPVTEGVLWSGCTFNVFADGKWESTCPPHDPNVVMFTVEYGGQHYSMCSNGTWQAVIPVTG